MNYVWESDYLIEENKKKLIHESFKIDSNEMLNQDKKFKERKLSDLMSYLEQYKKRLEDEAENISVLMNSLKR